MFKKSVLNPTMVYQRHMAMFLSLCLAIFTLTTAQTTPGVVPDPECGLTKGCFSDCSKTSCSYLVTWKEDGDNGIYSLTSKVTTDSGAGAWIAIGFSYDDKMGDDGVHGCTVSVNGDVKVFSAINPVQDDPKMYPDQHVILTSSGMSNNVFTCTFTRPKNGSADGRVDITQPWTLLFARGEYFTTNNDDFINYHGPNNRFISSAQFRISDMVTGVAAHIEFPKIKTHGCLMVFAWIMFASIGIVVARYYKPVWTEPMCSEKVWFQIHRTCMILVFATTAIGFIVIFSEVQGWSDLDEEERKYLRGHPIMGIIVMALTLLNPVMALFRCHPNTPKRPIFNWAHWFVGTSAHILGVITIFFGVQLNRADAPHYLIYILAGYVAWQILVELSLEAISCFGRKQAKKDVYEMNDANGPTKPEEPKVETDLTLFVKRIIIVAHIFVVSAVAAVLVALIAVGKSKLDKD